MHLRVHMHAHAHGCVRTPKTLSDTPRRRHQDPLSAHTCAHACACIHVHMYACMGARVYGMYTHICTSAHMYAYTFTHTRMWMYICTHASTPGTTAPQRQGKELMQTPEASHISPVQRNQPHLASLMPGLHCTHFLRHHYSSTPHPLFLTYPKTVRGPRILGGRGFTVLH